MIITTAGLTADTKKKPSFSPTITLRKGNIEIEVKNAAAIIKKIEEMYPNSDWTYWKNSPVTERNLQLEKQIKMVEYAKSWFKQEMFGTGSGDFEVVVREPETFSLKYDKERSLVTGAHTTSDGEFTSEAIDCMKEFSDNATGKELLTDASRSHPPVQTVNKNAYEIRSDILIQSLDWTKFKRGCSPQTNISDDDVLTTAQKFYKFVENRR